MTPEQMKTILAHFYALFSIRNERENESFVNFQVNQWLKTFKDVSYLDMKRASRLVSLQVKTFPKPADVHQALTLIKTVLSIVEQDSE